TPLRVGEGAVGRAVAERAPVQVPDILAEHAYDSRLRGVMVRAGLRALLAIPLVREGHAVGGLVLARNTSGAYAEDALDLMGSFAAQSALAIQNARLFAEVEETSKQLEQA